MQSYVIWFGAALALVAAELLSGTFYLLVIGIGVGAGGVAALLGSGFGTQLAVASAISVAGIVLLRFLRIGMRAPGDAPGLSFDTGQPVEVIERRHDGSLRVNYRGTQWDAEVEGPAGEHLVIKATRGNTLVLVAQDQVNTG